MYDFRVEQLSLPDACLIHYPAFGDERGRFSVISESACFAAMAMNTDWVQENESLSGVVGTLRGLHAQRPPFAQAKLVRCVAGRILDVFVDARPASKSCGQFLAIELSPDTPCMLYVPKGFLHGFLTLEPDTIVNYKVDTAYAPDHEFSVAWDDPALGIDWPIEAEKITLSAKDQAGESWAEHATTFAALEMLHDGGGNT